MVLKVYRGISEQAVDTVRIKQTVHVVAYCWTLQVLEWPHKSYCNYCLHWQI